MDTTSRVSLTKTSAAPRPTRRRLRRALLARAFTTATLGTALATALGGSAVPATAAPATRYQADPLQVIEPHDLDGARGRERPAPAPNARLADVTRPAAGTYRFGPGDGRGWASAAGAPVAIRTEAGSRGTARVWSRADAERLGALGYAVTLPGTAADVRLSYAGLATAGGDLAGRLSVVQYPACVQTSPEDPACSTGTTLRADRDAAGRILTVSPRRTSGDTVLALTTEAAGNTGDWSATSLSGSSSWQAGDSSGAFSWNYPIRSPRVAAATDPGLALSYNSGSVDGRAVAENNQPSWVGEGFDLGSGFIERSYRTCADDMGGGANNGTKTGDLCWAGDQVSISFGQWSGELVRTSSGAAESASTWRLRTDDGAKLERRTTGGFNTDNNGEYWVLTAPDGTAYYFGQNRVTATGAAFNSAWTVPVFGNHPGEPCYNTSYASAACTQVWRWNLDRVVDPQGNVSLYTYAAETNKYGKNLNKAVASYTRGGYLTQIAYGLRSGSEGATAPAKVLFAVAERCIPTPTFDCAESKLTATNASKWPDVPFDQICGASATTCPDRFSPSFFTRKRLTKVTTQAYSAGAYANVDSWTLAQSFPATGDNTSPSLWLESIEHTGHVGTAVTLPKVMLYGVNMDNRVDGIGDYAEPFHKRRVVQIVTESGTNLSVVYSDMECTPTNLPVSEPNNAKLCFPQMYAAPGMEAKNHWFHKYVVTQLTVTDQSNSGSQELVKEFDYLGSPAWAYLDRPGIKAKHRGWSQWRGFGRVRTTEGGADTTPKIIETLYHRGLDGDKAVNDPSDTTVKNVSIVDSEGVSTPDHWRLQGTQREIETFAAVGGQRLTSTITTYDTEQVAANGGRVALRALPKKDETRTFITGGARFQTTRLHTYDGHGFLVSTDDHARRIASDGTLSRNDRTCLTRTYARNTTKWILDKVATEQKVDVACTVTPAIPGDIVMSNRTSYDNLAVGAAPTVGNPTLQESLLTDGVTQRWVVSEKATYDAYGRTIESRDAADKATTRVYSGAAVAGGWAGKVTETGPDPDDGGPLAAHVLVTDFDVRIAKPVKVTQPNTLFTEATYDGLGRLLKVWGPGRSKATDIPNSEFSYKLSETGHNAVTTKALLPSGAVKTTIDLYDGLLRKRQTQTETQTNDGAGNPVTATWIDDILYDSRGQVAYHRPFVLATGTPTTTIQAVSQAAISNETRTTYDASGRVTADILAGRNASTGNQLQELSRTTFAYTGETTTRTPPAGGTKTATVVDARGHKARLDRFKTAGGAPVSYLYDYDSAGQLVGIEDPDGNTWSYTYDSLGRRTRSVDPDAGTVVTTYDDRNRPVTSTMDPDGTAVVASFDHDNLGRKTAEYIGAGTGRKQLFGWSYDTAGTRGVGHPAATTTYHDGTLLRTDTVLGYDTGGRATGTTVKYSAVPGLLPATLTGAYTVTNSYQVDGSPKSSLTGAIGDLPEEMVTVSYDNLGRLEGLTGLGAYVRSTDYLPFGQNSRLTYGSVFGQVLWADSWYDTATYQLDTLKTNVETTAAVDSIRSYTYDADGNATRIQDVTSTGDGTDTQCFDRDGFGQLTAAWTPADGVCAPAQAESSVLGGPAPYRMSWTYDDRTGNRLTQRDSTSPASPVEDVYTYPTPGSARPHAVSSVTRTGGSAPGTTGYGYDDRGNTTTRGDQTLVWDVRNRLSEVKVGSESLQRQVSDDEGKRILRVANNRVTVYFPDGTEASAAADGTGSVDAERYYSFGGQTVAHRTGAGGSTVTSLVNDHQGTPIYGYVSTSTVLTPRRQTPFGGVRGTASGLDDALPGERRFVGGTQDAATGLVQVGTRPYDPVQGRFLSTDPVIDLGDPVQIQGAYAYSKNDPIRYSDPSGNFFLDFGFLGSIISALLSAPASPPAPSYPAPPPPPNVTVTAAEPHAAPPKPPVPVLTFVSVMAKEFAGAFTEGLLPGVWDSIGIGKDYLKLGLEKTSKALRADINADKRSGNPARRAYGKDPGRTKLANRIGGFARKLDVPGLDPALSFLDGAMDPDAESNGERVARGLISVGATYAGQAAGATIAAGACSATGVGVAVAGFCGAAGRFVGGWVGGAVGDGINHLIFEADLPDIDLPDIPEIDLPDPPDIDVPGVDCCGL